MDAPNGEFDSLRVERLPPGKNVLVDAVDERAVEVEEKCGVSVHLQSFSLGSSAPAMIRIRHYGPP